VAVVVEPGGQVEAPARVDPAAGAAAVRAVEGPAASTPEVCGALEGTAVAALPEQAAVVALDPEVVALAGRAEDLAAEAEQELAAPVAEAAPLEVEAEQVEAPLLVALPQAAVLPANG